MIPEITWPKKKNVVEELLRDFICNSIGLIDMKTTLPREKKYTSK